MSRRKARETALQSLFQLDFNKVEPEDAFMAALGESDILSDNAREYARKIVTGTVAHLSEIDELITNCSREWKLERMAGVDRNIVRMAVYEMRFNDEQLTPNIIVNEAVELAKKFGTDASGKFVNGVLGAIIGK